MVRDPFLDNLIGKKKFLPMGTPLDNKTIAIFRPSSYGDFFFVAPVIKEIRKVYKNCRFVYVANRNLELDYIRYNLPIDDVMILSVVRLESDWWNEEFEMPNFVREDLLALSNRDDVVFISYEGTDGDYCFGDFSCNAYRHYFEGAGLEYSECKLDRGFAIPEDELREIIEYLKKFGIYPGEYVAFHPFSSQPGRKWDRMKTFDFLSKYSCSLFGMPLVVLGTKNEGELFSPFPNVINLCGDTSFLHSLGIVKLSKLGVFTESCLMNAAQAMNVSSVITHHHRWTANFTAPYHSRTVNLFDWNINTVLEGIKECQKLGS